MKAAMQVISLVVGGLLLVYTAGNGILEPGRREADAAIIIQQNATVNPANDGKIVAITGPIKMLKAAYSAPVRANSPVLMEKLYSYERKSEDKDSKDYDVYEFKSYKTQRHYGTVQVGDFLIDKTVLEDIPESDIRHQENFEGLEHLTRLNRKGYRTNIAKGAYYSHERDRRIRRGSNASQFFSFDINKYPTVTFVGKQDGNTLKAGGVHQSFYTKAIEQKDIEESGTSYTTLAIMGVLGIGLVGFGWYKHEW